MRSLLLALLAALLVGLLVVVAPGGAGGTAASAPSAPSAAAAPRCAAGEVSLTFDDGPSASVTPRLVRTLTRLRVPATFFMVGERVATAPAAARLVDRSGFLVANHSYRHADLRTQTTPAVRETLRATHRRLRAAGTRPTRLMRPPYGSIDARVRAAVRDVGLVPVLWDVDPRDWERVSSATIAARILAGLRRGRSNVVLQHDGIGNSAASVAAVPRVVREARRRGYCFVALDDRGRPGFPVPTAAVRTSGGREGGRATVRVRLDRPTARTTSVRVRTVAGSAEPGSDFTSRDVLVRIPAGRTRGTVRIPLRRDGRDERDERFSVELTEPFGLRLRRTTGSVRILDRDRPPRVSVADAVVEEPLVEATTVEVVVRLERRSGRTVRLHLVDVPGTADHADYDPVDLVVRVPAGEKAVRVLVTVHPDLLDEPEETFALRVESAVHARWGDRSGTVTITPPPPSRKATESGAGERLRNGIRRD